MHNFAGVSQACGRVNRASLESSPARTTDTRKDQGHSGREFEIGRRIRYKEDVAMKATLGVWAGVSELLLLLPNPKEWKSDPGSFSLRMLVYSL